jgi:hypothetical protein
MKRNYFYLGEQNIGIEASQRLLDRIQENIEEIPSVPLTEGAVIRVYEPEKSVKIIKDKNFPFASTRENFSQNYPGVDLFRYGTRVRTIWRKSNLEYEVETTTELDEKAVLRCFKNIYFENNASNKFLLHGALINVQNQGILITGKVRSGKSTLVQELAVSNNAQIISGGNSLISEKDMKLFGNYIPRPFYIRFSSIANNPQLSKLLENPQLCNAVQYLDEDAIKKIIKLKAFDVDGGLCVSRKKYADLLSIKTKISSDIDKIVFTQYKSGMPTIEKCTFEEALRLFGSRLFPKKTDLFKLEETSQILPVACDLNPEIIKKLKLIKVSFSGNSSLTPSLLEDIISAD